MTSSEARNKQVKKLVNLLSPASLEGQPAKRRSTKKRARKKAPAHLRDHQVGDRCYYYYIRGKDKEVYLGDADSILEAVRARKGDIK